MTTEGLCDRLLDLIQEAQETLGDQDIADVLETALDELDDDEGRR